MAFSPFHRDSAEIVRDFFVLMCFLYIFPSVLTAGVCRVFLCHRSRAGRGSYHLCCMADFVPICNYMLQCICIVRYVVPIERGTHGTTPGFQPEDGRAPAPALFFMPSLPSYFHWPSLASSEGWYAGAEVSPFCVFFFFLFFFFCAFSERFKGLLANSICCEFKNVCLPA